MYKAVHVHLKFSDDEEQMDAEREMPVLDLRLTEEDEKQTLDLDEGFGDLVSNDDAELLKENKVG